MELTKLVHHLQITWPLWWSINSAFEDTGISRGGSLLTLSWTPSVFDNPSTFLQNHHSRSGHSVLWNSYLLLLWLLCLHPGHCAENLHGICNCWTRGSRLEDFVINWDETEQIQGNSCMSDEFVSLWVHKWSLPHSRRLSTAYCSFIPHCTFWSTSFLLFLLFLGCWKARCFWGSCCAIEDVDFLPHYKKENNAL